MKRLMHVSLMLSLALAATACTEPTSSVSKVNLVQLSSVQWEEVAAANSAASVTNNNLIMMR